MWARNVEFGSHVAICFQGSVRDIVPMSTYIYAIIDIYDFHLHRGMASGPSAVESILLGYVMFWW